jgi:outer membrane protein assembly factor BamB
VPAAHNDWPTYLADQARTSASDVLVGPLVSPRWTHVLSGFIASEPVLANNRVYVGAWDGYLYALDAFDGHELWRTFLGTYQIKPGCPGAKFNLGITTAPTFDPGSNLLYVSAMSATVIMTDDMSYRFDTGPYLYALDAFSGTIQWQQILSANSDNYAWSSPLIANGHAYVGVASQGDCPLTPGQLVAVDLASPHTSQSVSMAPDSLTVYPNALITSPNPPTSTLLADGTNYRFTATATIAFIAPLSAAINIRLHGIPNTLYQPELRVMNSAIPCEPAPLLSFVQFLDAPKFSDVYGEVTLSRTVGLDTAAVNDDKHVLVVDSLVPCSKFVAGVGGGIWSSPTYDAVAHRVYVTTGTPTPPCVPQATCTGAAATLGPRSAAVVALNADTLAVDWSWQVPFRDQDLDADFGATPALCSADISKRMLGAANKNGVFYAFDTEVPGSPVWQRTLARGGGGPEVGEGSISSAACSTLARAGRRTTPWCAPDSRVRSGRCTPRAARRAGRIRTVRAW